jgi:thioredoxin-related protein
VDLNHVFNEHECFYCNRKARKRHTVEKLRQGAQDYCPASQLWLTCIEWAASESLEHSDIESIKIRKKHLMRIVKISTAVSLRLMVFQLEGKSAQQLSRGRD